MRHVHTRTGCNFLFKKLYTKSKLKRGRETKFSVGYLIKGSIYGIDPEIVLVCVEVGGCGKTDIEIFRT